MVLSIWNERVNIAKERYEPLRTCALVRNFNTLEFALFETETVRYNTLDYLWSRKRKPMLCSSFRTLISGVVLELWTFAMIELRCSLENLSVIITKL